MGGSAQVAPPGRRKTIQRLAARSSGRASESRSISIGSSTLIFSSGVRARAAQWRVSAFARSGSVSNETLTSIIRSMLSTGRAARFRPSSTDIATVSPSERAIELAQEFDKDPRFVEVVLSESKRVVRHRACSS